MSAGASYNIPKNIRTLLSAEQIERRVGELGEQISQDYRGLDAMLVGVLNGAMVFMSDLTRRIRLPSVEVYSMAASSYDGVVSRGVVSITMPLGASIRGRHVIVVEDIVDSGLTLQWLLEHLQADEPASLAVCALMDKAERRVVDVPLRYVGFRIPDEFVVGYGLDYEQRYRNLPFVGVIADDDDV